ncbi:MAG TPA: N-acetylmuramidase domain-containing protein, partial [Cytophagales bacterium]|nr:N-acetylmuramidase domain-containing protein [Cytophagales bacterium]
MTKPRLTNEEIQTQAVAAGYEYAAVKAVIMVECAGSGFTDDGVIKIQFEPHHFKEKLISNGVENQVKEWAAFDKAYAINKESAFRATSW